MTLSRLFVFCAIIFAVIARKPPPYILYCHRNDPNLKACFKSSLEKMIPHFTTGIPEFGIPAMNPFMLTEASLEGGNGFQAYFKDIKGYGFDDFTIDKVDVNLSKNHIDVYALYPFISVTAHYHINGKILLFNLNSDGPFQSNHSKSVVSLSLDGKRYVKNGKEFINFDKKKLDFAFNGKISLYLGNIFGDNEDLNNQINEAINVNARQFLSELKPIVEETASKFLFSFVDTTFSKYGVDVLFPK